MASFNFDLEIFCGIYYCGKFGDLIDSQIARVFPISQRRSVRNWSISAVGLLQGDKLLIELRVELSLS